MSKHQSDLSRLYELQLLSTAAYYDVSQKQGRQSSARDLTNLFLAITKVVKPDVFFEAGAESAETSRKIRNILPNTRIYAFEANPYNFKKYQEEFNYAEHDIEYLNLALSDSAGQLSFYLRESVGGKGMPRETGQNSILKRTDPSTTYEELTIEAVTLDRYFSAGEDNCLWIDVEGASQQVLKGATRLLRHTQVAFVEVEEREFWEGQWLAPTTVQFMAEHDLIPVARDFEYLSQYNILFLSHRAFANHYVRRVLQAYHSTIAVSRDNGEPGKH